MPNPLISDAFVDFLLDDVHHAASLTALPAFADHDPDTFRLFVDGARRFARQELFPTYRPMDLAPPTFDGVRVHTHPSLPHLYRGLVDLGLIAATRPLDRDGGGLPQLVAALGSAYLMAGNLSAYGYAGLTAGAAHLIEAFGTPDLDRLYRKPMLEGRFTGTMALTEPQAGSSLADVTTRATPREDGAFAIVGAKIFISGGDQSVTENVVHLLLARIDGAPEGTRGISLFVVPRLRPEGERWTDNDVAVSGVIHKIGWKGLPSVALSLGERGDCRGWLLGAPHQGLKCMFQMMNEARLMVGLNGAATASVAFHESLSYAASRPQGRTRSDGPQVPIIEHADVRRMLLRQKAIVEGALALLAETARLSDLSEHAVDPGERERARLVLDVLTPIAKSFPAEWGFESNALAVQVLGGYGYTSEYLPEAFLRDQKLNAIHEGTTGIQGLDLLGRKVVQKGGAGLIALASAMQDSARAARDAGLDEEDIAAFEGALSRVGALTATLGARGAAGDVAGMLGHSADYLALMSILAVSWQWLKLRTASKDARGRRADPFLNGLEAAGRYWSRTELPRIEHLAALCTSNERSYQDVLPEELG